MIEDQQLHDELITKVLKRIKSKSPVNKHLVFSCGSGITACVLALGAELIGKSDVSVYDGSWTEYGSLTTE